MNFLVKLVLYTVAIMLASYLLPGVDVENFGYGFVLAALLALLNITLKPLLIVLTIPFTVFTLGLFLLVINAIIILVADSIVPGTYVDGFWWALLFSLVVSILNALFSGMTKEEKR